MPTKIDSDRLICLPFNNSTAKLNISSLVVMVFICTLFFSCVDQEVDETVWFKGNTHAHTIICGHADTSPDSVALWYLNRGYHFLILSEHNHYINPDSVNLPSPRRSDFILIPGEEVTGHRHIHTTGMNTQKYVAGNPPVQSDSVFSGESQRSQLISSLRKTTKENKTEIMQRHTDDILQAGGLPILNHPNYLSGAQPQDILQVEGLHMLELYNGHPKVDNWGAEEHESVEEKWDSLLTAGMLVLGISSDDAHHFQTWNESKSNPGRGWTMVNSEAKLTADAITTAIAKGKFYASNGVVLNKVEHSSSNYEVQIDHYKTLKELESPYVTGKVELDGREGFLVSFIGANGNVLQSGSQLKSVYKISDETGYVRAKISYTRKTSEGKYESFFAWTQPQFLDERDQLLNNGHVWKSHKHN